MNASASLVAYRRAFVGLATQMEYRFGAAYGILAFGQWIENETPPLKRFSLWLRAYPAKPMIFEVSLAVAVTAPAP